MESMEISRNQLLMRKALETLKGKWRIAAPAAIIYGLITAGANSLPAIGPLVSLLVSGVLVFGLHRVFLKIVRGETPVFTTLFDGIYRYGTILLTHLLTIVFVCLWGVLLIVPGIVAAFSYSMTFFILNDDETVTPFEAIQRSKDLMYGHRMDLFYLTCRFIGWFIVGIVTGGIGFIWVLPYLTTSYALFYQNLIDKSQPEQKPAPESYGQHVAEISDLIIERVMALNQSIKEKEALEREVRATVASLMSAVDLTKEEIEKIAAEVLAEYAPKSSPEE